MNELTEAQQKLIRSFPAKYSQSVIEAIESEIIERGLSADIILDCFAGVGGIHALSDRLPNIQTLGIDIEPEQAALHPRTIHGDSRHARKLIPDLAAACDLATVPFQVDAIVTSPAYGNRFADQYLGSDEEKCRPCNGRGWKVPKALVGAVTGTDGKESKDNTFVESMIPEADRIACTKCKTTGKSKSDRQGYAIALDRTLSEGSGAALYWGPQYKELHVAVIDEVATMLRPGGWWLVNISSVLGPKGYMPVMEWWVDRLAERATIRRLRAIETPRSRKGENHERRVPVEHLIVAQNPPLVLA